MPSALQSNVDDSGRGQEVLAAEGIFTQADTLHVGYGNGFTTLRLTGAGLNFVGDGSSFKGTLLVCTANDRPGLNVQGGRYSEVSRLTLKGVNRDFLYLASPAIIAFDGTIDCFDKAVWCGSAMTANAHYNGRNTPYAGITTDAYTGSRPSPSYPDVAYPVELDLLQWNKDRSSQVSIRDVSVHGFYVGICTDPSGADGNGDFLNCHNCSFGFNVIGAAVSHSQARITRFHDTSFEGVHTVLTTVAFGAGIGAAGVSFSHCALGANVQLFDVATSYAGSIVFHKCYGELVYMLGHVGDYAGGNTPVVLENCEINFGQMGKIGIPAWMATGGANAGVVLRGGRYTFEDITIFGCHLVIDRAVVLNLTLQAHVDAATDTLAMRRAQNLTLGVLPNPNLIAEAADVKIASGCYFPDVTVPGGVDSLWPGPFKPGGRRKTIPWSVREIRVGYAATAGHPHPAPRPLVSAWGKDAGHTYVSFSGLDLSTGVGHIAIQETGMPHQPGDVLIDDQTGTVFRVESSVVSGSTCTDLVTVLNNFKRGPQTLRTPMTSDTGTLWLLRSGMYATTYMLYGDFTMGSAVIDNVSRGDGVATFLESDLGEGDYLLLGYEFGHYFAGGLRWVTDKTQIASRSNSGGTDSTGSGQIVMNLPALRTGTKVPLGYFLRNDL